MSNRQEEGLGQVSVLQRQANPRLIQHSFDLKEAQQSAEV